MLAAMIREISQIVSDDEILISLNPNVYID